MKRSLLYIGASALLLSILTTACQGEQVPEPQKPVTPPAEKPTEPVVSQFKFIDKTFTASFTDADSRLNFQYDSKITFTWGNTQDEAIGVYKIKNNAITKYAGLLKGDSKSSDTSMTFKGRLIELEEGESYYYITPAPKDGEGKWIEYTTGLSDEQINALNTTASSYKLSWDEQKGGLEANANNLRDYFPLVWRGESASLSKEAAAIHVVLNFNENPGTIQSIQLETMAMGSEDKAFPKAYSYANLANVNNNSELASSFKMLFNNASPTVNEGIYTANAFMVTGFVNGLNVFNKKYRIVATCSNGTYKSEYRSFPGQEDQAAQTSKHLTTFANGSTYKMTRPMSKAGSFTLISTAYKTLSALGMWNEDGILCDPDTLMCKQPERIASIANALISTLSTRPNYSSYIYSNSNPTPWSKTEDLKISTTWTGTRGSHPQDYYYITTIKLDSDSEVDLTYIKDYTGGNRNTLGYYFYTKENNTWPNHDDINKYVLYPNASLSVTGLNTKNTVHLLYKDAAGYTSKTFPANTYIGFFMMINSYQDKPGTSEDYVQTTGPLFSWSQWKLFTDAHWNEENKKLPNSTWSSWGRANWFFSTNIKDNSNMVYFSIRDDGADNTFSDMQFIISAWGTDNSAKTITTRNKLQINADGTISAIQ